MLRSSALRSRRGRGIIRIRNAPIFIIAGLSPNITACYLLVRSYRLIGVGHHFDFPSFVPQTSITTVDPSFGLINLNDFISGQSCFFPSTRPTSAASSTAASTPTTRTLSRHHSSIPLPSFHRPCPSDAHGIKTTFYFNGQRRYFVCRSPSSF